MGTVRIVDGKLEFNFPDKRDEEIVIGVAPLDKMTPTEFMQYTVRRFLFSTFVVVSTEESDKVWYKEKTRVKKARARKATAKDLQTLDK